MNLDKIDRFDTDYFRSLNEKDKETYFISYIRKTLDKMERKETCSNDN